MHRPENYDWWIDSIQDCLCQIAGRFDDINPRSNACKHVCDETYIDLSHFVECVLSNGFLDVPTNHWNIILELAESDNLEANTAVSAAQSVLDASYFLDRPRWPYAG